MKTKDTMAPDLQGLLQNLGKPKLAQNDIAVFHERLEGQKSAIMAALEVGRQQGKPDDLTLSPEQAWGQIQFRAGNLHAIVQSTEKQKDGERTDAFVALLAPVYRRYTGKKATVSQGRKSDGQGGRASGPFPRFICAVAGAFDLPAPLTPDTIDKAIDRIKSHTSKGEDDARAEAQALFGSDHQSTVERYAPAIAKLIPDWETTLDAADVQLIKSALARET